MTPNYLPKKALALFNHIHFLTQNAEGYCCAGNDYLADKTDLSPLTVKKYISWLKAWNAIYITHKGHGRRFRMIYVMLSYKELITKYEARQRHIMAEEMRELKKISKPFSPEFAPGFSPKQIEYLYHRENQRGKKNIPTFEQIKQQPMADRFINFFEVLYSHTRKKQHLPENNRHYAEDFFKKLESQNYARWLDEKFTQNFYTADSFNLRNYLATDMYSRNPEEERLWRDQWHTYQTFREHYKLRRLTFNVQNYNRFESLLKRIETKWPDQDLITNLYVFLGGYKYLDDFWSKDQFKDLKPMNKNFDKIFAIMDDRSPNAEQRKTQQAMDDFFAKYDVF